jgi:hypothetical protein
MIASWMQEMDCAGVKKVFTPESNGRWLFFSRLDGEKHLCLSILRKKACTIANSIAY